MGNTMEMKRGRTNPKRWRRNQSIKNDLLLVMLLLLLCIIPNTSSAWQLPSFATLPLEKRQGMRTGSSFIPLAAGWKRGERIYLKMTATENERETRKGKNFVSKDGLKVNGEKPSGPLKQNSGYDSSPDHQVCRVVALPDGKLPTAKSDLPSPLLEPPHLLDKLDTIYNAMSHDETRPLRYLERSKTMEPVIDEEEEKNLVSLLRNSLEDAGFQLLTRRDVDLCEALNAGYLLRLSIAPDVVGGFDPTISREFYPERYDQDGNSNDEMLFGGRVLLYRRGYSSEVTEGRLLLPKLDYLQTSVVQRSARAVTDRLGRLESRVASILSGVSRSIRIVVQNRLAQIASSLPNPSVARFLRVEWGWKEVDEEILDQEEKNTSRGFFKFSRYGGSKNRLPNSVYALDPFLSCDTNEIEFINGENVDGLSLNFNTSEFACLYDLQDNISSCNEDVLLERISINNVVDLTTSRGRRNVVKRFFAKSKLVEPTLEEIVAIWRPLPEKPKPKLLPPKFVYTVAEIFEVEDKLPEFKEPEPDPLPPPIEIRSFDGVPMANAPAVLPKTKLLFRPADAFVFDFITFFSLAAVIFSQRFDNPRLDLLALVSGTVWLIRTAIRYSNKLARYDLMVKKFLGRKISHRNSGALKYLAREAGNQRATRAALVYLWLVEQVNMSDSPVLRSKLVRQGSLGVNELLQAKESSHRYVLVDIDAALNDLSDLNLIQFGGGEGEVLTDIVTEEGAVVETLRTTWNKVFDDTLGHDRLIGRRTRRFWDR